MRIFKVIYILQLFFLLITLINSSGSLYCLESNWGISEASKVRLISPLSHNNNKDKIIIGLEYHLEQDPTYKIVNYINLIVISLNINKYERY